MTLSRAFTLSQIWESGRVHRFITFVLPKDGTYPEAMTKAAEGKTKLGVAYVVKDGVSYAVVLFG